MNTGQAPV